MFAEFLKESDQAHCSRWQGIGAQCASTGRQGDGQAVHLHGLAANTWIAGILPHGAGVVHGLLCQQVGRSLGGMKEFACNHLSG